MSEYFLLHVTDSILLPKTISFYVSVLSYHFIIFTIYAVLSIVVFDHINFQL